MNEILFNLLLGVVTATVSGLFVIIIPGALNWLKNSKYKTAYFWVEIAVKAAEKMYKESGMGKTKKEYVKKFIDSINTKFNLNLTAEQIDALIEACCLELDNEKEKSNTTTVYLGETLSTLEKTKSVSEAGLKW
jgi:hypothetical protein